MKYEPVHIYEYLCGRDVYFIQKKTHLYISQYKGYIEQRLNKIVLYDFVLVR